MNYRFIFFGACLLVSVTGYGMDYPLELANAFVAYVKAQGGGENARTQAVEPTKGLRYQCALCHGENGIAVDPKRPNLAAQQPLYIIKQLKGFKARTRHNLFMQGMANRMADEDVFNLALFYGSQKAVKPPEPRAKDAKLIAGGKQVYSDRCQYCHGADARGQGIYARLAGQNKAYLVNSITNFRDIENQRKHAGMSAITRGLSNMDVINLSLFLTHLD